MGAFVLALPEPDLEVALSDNLVHSVFMIQTVSEASAVKYPEARVLVQQDQDPGIVIWMVQVVEQEEEQVVEELGEAGHSVSMILTANLG